MLPGPAIHRNVLIGGRSQPIELDTATLDGSIYSDEPREYHLAVSGDAFRWMMDFGPLETLQRVSPAFELFPDFILTSDSLADVDQRHNLCSNVARREA